MNISLNWLKKYIDAELDPERTADILTNTGLEVESKKIYEPDRFGLEELIIGEILTCEKHPDADKLWVTTVNTGSGKPLRIVCGAPNTAAGCKVLVARPGSKIKVEGESVEIKKTRIRGQESEGMICAEDEAGLGTSHEGIMILEDSAVPGTPAIEYFEVKRDYIFEIGLTPNRIDAASHIGVARDLAAFLGQANPVTLKRPSVEGFKTDNNENFIDVEIENRSACPRYSALTISGIKTGPSPQWLQNLLRATGHKPVNNIVDITNFVMLETGQPLHAFNADKIEGKKVVVRNLPAGTPFVTLDNEKLSLSDEDLMICDTRKGMCIAGVYGGIETGIDGETCNIFLESAHFNPVSVRKTAKRYGLSTDASFRFERGADPNITVYALKRTAMLIKEIAGGNISSDVVDVYPETIPNAIVRLTYTNLYRLVGEKIDPFLIKKILQSLEIIIRSESETGVLLEIPAYRTDVTREADVIEEFLRIYGYNRVPVSESVSSTISYAQKPDREKIFNTVANMLSSKGFYEIMTNSITRSSNYSGQSVFPEDHLARLLNPLSADLDSLRQTLIFGGLETVAYNVNRKNSDLMLYEFGNVYRYNNKKGKRGTLDNYREKECLSLLLSGRNHRDLWNEAGREFDFFDLKGYVEVVLGRIVNEKSVFKAEEAENELFSECLRYSAGNRQIAWCGRISNPLLKMFDIQQDVLAAEISWSDLIKIEGKHSVTYSEIPKYPEVSRDLAMMLDRNVKFEQIKEIAFRTEKKLLKSITLFDVYEGEKIEKRKKSYAVNFILQDPEKTLTDSQIDKAMELLAKAFEKEVGARIRR